MKPAKNFEVLIIGGGIIGLSLARALYNRGVRQIGVLEKNSECGNESSSAAAGILAPQSEADRADDFFRFCSEARDLYPSFAAEILAETGIDIELDESGTLYLAFTEHDREELEKRYAWQKAANLRIESLSTEEILEIEPNLSPEVVSGLLFPRDWQVENRKLVAALRKFAAEAEGIETFTGAEIKNLQIENDRVTIAETANENFSAETIVLTTGAWTSGIRIENQDSPLNIRPVRGQMMSFRAPEKMFSKVIYTPRGYLVPRRDNRILAGATVEDAGFDKTLTAEGANFLLVNAFEIAPGLAKLQIAENWAGLRPRAADNLPVLGEFPEVRNLLIATAHYRNGILLAPKTAAMMADKIIENRESEFLRIFSPQRFLQKAREISS